MISLYDMLEAADGQLFGEPAAQIFTDLAINIDEVREGCLFVALETEQGDGHLHLKEAIERGALGLMCVRPPEFDVSGVTVFIVRHPEQALIRWVELVLRRFGTTVIGVTGITGKSTAKAATAAVLSKRYNVYNAPHVQDGRLGLPLALRHLTAQHQLAVVQLVSKQPDDMAAMLGVAQPLVGVVTNLNTEPVGQLPEADVMLQDAQQLVQHLDSGSLAVLNFDDSHVRPLAEQTTATVFSIGIDSFDADLLAYNVVAGRFRTGFDLRYGAERHIGRWVELLGRHQLYSIMAALAVGLSYQVPLEDAIEALMQLQPLPGRMRPLKGINESLLIDDSFNASPQSTLASLDWLRSVREDRGRLVFVLGDMDRSGSYLQRAYHQLGARIGSETDLFVTQGHLAATAARSALDYGVPREQVHMSFSHSDTAAVLRAYLQPNDVVLIKGGAAAHMEQVVRQVLADDTEAEHLPERDFIAAVVPVDRRISPSWIEIDREATAANVRKLRALLGANVALLAMVPGDAMGHGAITVGSTAILNGAVYLGVASMSEAVDLREAGLEAPIFVMGHVPPWAVRDATYYRLTLSIHDWETARAYHQVARDLRQILHTHVHADSGLGHYGMLPAEITNFFRSIRQMPYLRVEGIYTQFANSANDPGYTQQQLSIFRNVVNPLQASGIELTYIHAADTASMLKLPESHFNLVRCDSLLHGIAPAPGIELPEGLQPTLQWKTTIAQVRELPRGTYVGEGATYRTMDAERIAVIPVGYVDGLPMESERWHEVLVGGQYVPLVGRVSAYQAALNVTRLSEVHVGDEVVLICRQGDLRISMESRAEQLGVSVYQLAGRILPRLPRW